MNEEKTVSYITTNTYQTLNTFTEKTKNVWIVFHGLGHLSRYFLEHFKGLNAVENYVIAPQAPSKYYQDKAYKYIGASWLTREHKDLEMQNVLAYVDTVYDTEFADKGNLQVNLFVLGFSQGVSIATRWLVARKIKCAVLILHSGSIPRSVQKEDINALVTSQTYLVYGTEDPFLTQEKLDSEEAYATTLFTDSLQVIAFKGKHVVDNKSIQAIAQSHTN